MSIDRRKRELERRIEEEPENPALYRAYANLLENIKGRQPTKFHVGILVTPYTTRSFVAAFAEEELFEKLCDKLLYLFDSNLRSLAGLDGDEEYINVMLAGIRSIKNYEQLHRTLNELSEYYNEDWYVIKGEADLDI